MPSRKKSKGARKWWSSLSAEQRQEQIDKRVQGAEKAFQRRQQEAGLTFSDATDEQLRDHILKHSGKAGEELVRRGAVLIVAWHGEAIPGL